MRIGCLWTVVAVAASAQTLGVYTAGIAPKQGETFAEPCRFELTIPAREVATRAVWVIYDRGPETRAFYDDATVLRFAEKQKLGLLWARHCPAAGGADIDMAPEHGLGRALFSALDELAVQSKHGELTSSKVLVLGYAEAAALAARLAEYARDRVLAAAVYAPVAIEEVTVGGTAIGVPQLVIANSADVLAGTRGPYLYFQKHFANGAPWTFVVQNGAEHEGALSGARDVLLAWTEALLETTADTTAPVMLASVQRSGWWLYIRMRDTAAKDESGRAVAMAEDAKYEKVGSSAPSGFAAAGWTGSKKAAAEWQSFVRKRSHARE